MIFSRILRYVLAFFVVMFILSLICLYQYRDVLAEFFSSTVTAGGGALLLLLIYGVGFFLLIRAVLR